VSLESLARLRRAGRRPDSVIVIVGAAPKWMDASSPDRVVIDRDPATLDLRPLVGLEIHLIDIQPDTDLLLRVMAATEEVGVKPLGACSAVGACGVSPEHERAMELFRENLCLTR
jgi:hypothetical protein